MRIEFAKPIQQDAEGSYYHLRIPQEQQYFFASVIESFSGLANHTTDRADKSVVIFFASRSQTAAFEEILKFLTNYENFE